MPALFTSPRLLALLLTLGPLPAQAAWITVMRGDFHKLQVSRTSLAAETETEIQLIHHGDPRLRRLPKPGHQAPLTEEDARDQRLVDEQRLVESLDLQARDLESRPVEDLLDSERRLRARRQKRASRFQASRPPPGHLVWALDGKRVWLGFAGGLWAWEDTLVKVREGLTEASPLGATHGQVASHRGRHVLVMDRDVNQGHELPTDLRPNHLAISESGARVALSDGHDVERFALPHASATARFAVPEEVHDLGFCGETLLLLSGASLLVMTPEGEPSWRALPEPARRILCTPDTAEAWVLKGQDFLRSVDEGKTWQVYGMPSGLFERDSAVSDNGAWIASASGIHFCAWKDWSEEGGVARPPRLSRPARHAPWWTPLLPKISLDASLKRHAEREELRGYLQASFALDRPPRARLAALDAAEAYPADPVPEAPPSPTPSLPGGGLPEPAQACLAETRKRAVQLSFGEPERARSYLRRAGRAAWLPELRVVFDRRFGRSESIDYPGSNVSLTSPLGVDTVNDLRYEARATWDLARLVFAPEEMSAQTQALRMAEQRRDVELQVNRLFFERLRLQTSRETDPAKAWKNHLRALEITGELDILSGDGFSRCTSSPVEANE